MRSAGFVASKLWCRLSATVPQPKRDHVIHFSARTRRFQAAFRASVRASIHASTSDSRKRGDFSETRISDGKSGSRWRIRYTCWRLTPSRRATSVVEISRVMFSPVAAGETAAR